MKSEKALVFSMCIFTCAYFLYTGLTSQDQNTVVRLLDRVTDSMLFKTVPAASRSLSIKTLSVCPSVHVTSRYAFVTYIGINKAVSQKALWYLVSACKLAVSILRFTGPEIDLVMLLAVEEGRHLPKYQQEMIEWSGWQICRINFITSSNDVKNRFYDAQIFTKLHVFRLAEYEAIACIDSDMFALKNASGLFHDVWPDMLRKNLTFAMGLDYPSKASKRSAFHYLIGKCGPGPSEYNGGIFVLQPSSQTYDALMVAMNNSTYDLNMCEQGLLNEFYRDRIYALPFKYNANLVTKVCEPEFYSQQRDGIVIMHFTVAKPWMNTIWTSEWMWTCPWWNLNEECDIWSSF